MPLFADTEPTFYVGFVDLLKESARTALFTLFMLFRWLLKEYFWGSWYGSPTIKALIQKNRKEGISERASNKHEATFFFLKCQVFLMQIVLLEHNKDEKRCWFLTFMSGPFSQPCPPYSLLTLMISKWESHPCLSPSVVITALYDHFALSALSRCRM